MDMERLELNITELRRKKRPLWMSDLAIEDYSEHVCPCGDFGILGLPTRRVGFI
jgi:hypothetical protein